MRSSALLQAVCKIFEAWLVQHGSEAELVEVETDTRAYIATPIKLESGLALIAHLNQQFRRKDHKPTFQLEYKELGIFMIEVSRVHDFAVVH